MIGGGALLSDQDELTVTMIMSLSMQDSWDSLTQYTYRYFSMAVDQLVYSGWWM